jgi:hypothetical protein
VAQVVERLLSKYEALNSNPSSIEKKKREGIRGGRKEEGRKGRMLVNMCLNMLNMLSNEMVISSS